MNEDLLSTLHGLRADPSLAITLYEQLYRGVFLALVQSPAGDLDTMSFLTYPSTDGLREPPLFTAEDSALLLQLSTDEPAATVVTLKGAEMWQRFLEILRTGDEDLVLAVDPVEPYGIRLTKEMVLGMLNSHGSIADRSGAQGVKPA